MSPILNTIDHIYLRAANAGVVYNELVHNAGLPIAWPFRSVTEGFASGAVSLGNLVLELVQTSENITTSVPEYGVALTPYVTITESRTDAAAHGIDVGADEPYYAPDGSLLWTRAQATQLSGPELDTFFCAYTADQWPLREGSREKLEASCGGALGIIGVESMTLTSTTVLETRERWALVAEDRADEEMPRVHVVPGKEEGLQGLTIRVHDGEQARRRFKDVAPSFPNSLKWRFV